MGCSEYNAEFWNNLTVIFSTISIIGCLFLMMLLVFCKILDKLTSKILIFISISDIIRSLALLFAQFKVGGLLCKFLGYTLNLSYILNVILALYIHVSAYKILIKQQPSYESIEKYWLTLIFIVCPALLALPFITDSYGRGTFLCTFNANLIGSLWRFCLIFSIEWPCMIISGLLFCKLYHFQREISKSPGYDLIINRGTIYSIIIYVPLVPLTVLRIFFIINYSCDTEFGIVIINTIFSLHGFFNSVAIFLNNAVRRAILEKYFKRSTSLHLTDVFNTNCSDVDIN